ncbi:putative efflux system component YknX [Moorella mulderi DSM 14980]|uniref:Putative efflux system component YknX n=2 Tax=Neomoorella TaxID=44260 RepID=A0A151B085_9FIRM|nr:putative efflux system component YknX [Moorella mulderi DSM 14980]
MLKRILAVAGIIVVIGGIITANVYRSRQPRGLPVKVAAVEERDMTTTVLTSGRAELAVEQEVTATVAGRVVSVLVQPGDRVEKGQTLVRLEATDLTAKVREAEAAVAVARANLNKGQAGAGPEEITAAKVALKQARLNLQEAQRKLARTRELAAAGAIPAIELEAAQNEVAQQELQVEQAEAKLKVMTSGPRPEDIAALEAQLHQAELTAAAAREQLGATTVAAPVTGMVLEVNIRAGQWVSPGTALLRVGDPATLQVRASVAEADSGSLQPGQEVVITGRAFWGTTYQGKVVRVAPAAVTRQSQQGAETTVEAIIALAGPAPLLKPGYSVDLKITTAARPKALTLPFEAIQEEKGQRYVYRIVDGKAQRVVVQTGLENELYIEVTSGLKAGDQVILNPTDKIKDGVAVKPEGEKQ